MSQPPEQVGTDDWRVAMIAMTRKDAANLAQWEDWATSAPPTVFGSWAEGFAADPALQSMMLGAYRDFWTRYVLTETPPPAEITLGS